MNVFKSRVVLAALACWLGAATAMAHDKDVERTLFIQVDDEGLVALWAVRGSGQRVELQGKMVDMNRDGKLSDGEKKLLAASMLQKGTAGITIDYAGLRLTQPAKFESKLKETPPGAKFIEAAGMASYAARGADKDSLAVEITVQEGYGPVTVQVQALGERFLGWVNRAIVAPDRKGLTVPVQLKPEQTLKVVVVTGKAPEPKERKDAH
jgi:hypothetical protein